MNLINKKKKRKKNKKNTKTKTKKIQPKYFFLTNQPLLSFRLLSGTAG